MAATPILNKVSAVINIMRKRPRLSYLLNKIGKIIVSTIDICCRWKILVSETGEVYFETNVARFTMYLIILIFFGLILWLICASTEQVVTVSGKFTTTSPTLTIKPYDKSIIKNIYITEGSFVKKGSPLIMLDTTLSGADVAQLKEQMKSLEAKIFRIKAELAGTNYSPPQDLTADANLILQKQIFVSHNVSVDSHLKEFKNNIHKIQTMLQTTKENIATYSHKLKDSQISDEIMDRAFKLRVVSKLQYFDHKQNTQDIALKLKSEQEREADLTAQLGSVTNEQSKFLADRSVSIAQELLEAENQQKLLGEKLKQASLANEMKIIRSPEDAVVLQIAKFISLNAIVDSTDPMVSLIPANAPLAIEANVETKDIGWIKLNDPVEIHLETLPFQRYGFLTGQVVSIAPDALLDSKYLFYKVKIKVTTNHLKKLPKVFYLRPGMIVQAGIIVGKKRFISYFTDPIVDAFSNSFHEP